MTPQGQGVPPQQQGFFQKNWKWLVALGVGLPMLCCMGGLFATMVLGYAVKDMDPEELNRALNQQGVQQGADQGADQADPDDAVANDEEGTRVDCGEPGPSGVDCDIKRTGGSAKLESCWDLEITCENGGVMKGHACGTLAAGAKKAVKNMPVSSFENQDACDVPKSGQVTNLVVNIVAD